MKKTVMFVGVALLSLMVVGCCTSASWMCECFPCPCVKCCCVYGAATLGVVFAVLGVIRVVVGKEGVDVVGGDETTRQEIAALLTKANYSVNTIFAETWKIGVDIVSVRGVGYRISD